MWRFSRVVLPIAFSGALGCSPAHYAVSDTGAPSLVVPIHVAEGHGDPQPADAGVAPSNVPPPAASSAPVASGSPAPVEIPATTRAGSAPDPAPLTTADQWKFTFVYDKGNVQVGKVERVVLAHPVPTARRFGRFAVELRVGPELVDRVRFDFPLLANDSPGTGSKLHDPPRFGPGAKTQEDVLVPNSDRATKAVLIDRLMGTALPLPWPPSAATEPASTAPQKSETAP